MGSDPTAACLQGQHNVEVTRKPKTFSEGQRLPKRPKTSFQIAFRSEKSTKYRVQKEKMLLSTSLSAGTEHTTMPHS